MAKRKLSKRDHQPGIPPQSHIHLKEPVTGFRLTSTVIWRSIMPRVCLLSRCPICGCCELEPLKRKWWMVFLLFLKPCRCTYCYSKLMVAL